MWKNINFNLVFFIFSILFFTCQISAARTNDQVPCPSVSQIQQVIKENENKFQFILNGNGVLTINGFPWLFTATTTSNGTQNPRSFWQIFQENQTFHNCKIWPRNENSPCTYTIDATLQCTGTVDDLAELTITYDW